MLPLVPFTAFLLALLNRNAFLDTLVHIHLVGKSTNAVAYNDSHNDRSMSSSSNASSNIIKTQVEGEPSPNTIDLNSIIPLSLEEAVVRIQNETPVEFMQAVEISGKKFLYRGEDIDTMIINDANHVQSNNANVIVERKTCIWMNPEPDLLLPGTYSDENALLYFNHLEDCLKHKEMTASEGASLTRGKMKKVIARPSNAHIGTSNIVEASKWGEAVSVWPCSGSPSSSNERQNSRIDDDNFFSYCFLKNRDEFFSDDYHFEPEKGTANIKRMRNFISFQSIKKKTNNGQTSNKCDDIDTDLIIDSDLDIALSKGKEVMFSSTDEWGNISSAFIAIPSKYDAQLRSILFPSMGI